MSWQGRLFMQLPPSVRSRTLRRLGRYAPWQPEFDFTPPELAPGEIAGPPDWVGIGAQKAGTTWWNDLIFTHPGTSTRPGIHKERHFFDRFGSMDFDEAATERYHGWFPRRPGTLTGEWTPDYFAYPWVPDLLHRAAPATRLLLLLRDPVERLRSGIDHQLRMGEPSSGAALADAVQRGFYTPALSRWLESFDRSQLLVLQYERCVVDLEAQIAETFRFLGLTEYHVSDTEYPRRSPELSPRGRLGPEVKRRLTALYQPDVLALAERLPELDLRLWPNFAYLAGGDGPGSEAPVASGLRR